MQLFELVRFAVNGNEQAAKEYFESLRARERGEKPPEPKLISGPEDLALFLRGRL